MQSGEFHFYSCGRELYPVLKDLFRAARREILISVYCLHNDPVGLEFARLLSERARAGVKVRVLFDSLGSWGDQREMLYRLRRGGVEARIFRDKRTYVWKRPASFLYRNHARLFLVDREMVGLGGINIGEIYLEREDNFWLTRIGDGEKAAQLFEAWWRLAETHGRLPEGLLKPYAIKNGWSAFVSGPHRSEQMIYDWLLRNINQSRRRISIAASWFFPDVSIVQELRAAVARGVEVEITTPLQTDREKYDGFRALPLWTLLKTNLRWYGTPTYFHQKIFLCDDAWTFGSANCDIISLRRNYELNVFGAGGEILELLDQNLERLKLGLEPTRENPTPWVFRKLNGLIYGVVEYFMSASPLKKETV